MLSNKTVLEVIEKYEYSRQNILFILHELQKKDKENCIREEYANIIRDNMNIMMSEIYDILTFYSMFNEDPKGKYIIEVCNSGPCFIREGKNLVKDLEDILKVKVGETTKDGLFTIKYTSCIGACDKAPAFKIGENIYGNLTKDKITSIIQELKEDITWRN